MAISLKHFFQSLKGDGTDTTKVQPSHWNAEHVITAAINMLLGTDGASTTVKEIPCTAAGRALLDDADAAAQRATLGVATVPVGAGFDWYTDTLPVGEGGVEYGWANGQALSRSTYAALFALYGTTHGAGDGSTTFNLPDKRGRVGAGKDNMGGAAAANRLTTAGSGVDGATLGASGGQQNRTIAQANLPAVAFNGTCSVSVSVSGTTSGHSADHTHTYDALTTGGVGGTPGGTGLLGANTGGTTSGTSADHTHSFSGSGGGSGSASVSSGGSGTALIVQPPTLVCNHVIRIK